MLDVTHPQYIRKINQHKFVRVGLDSTRNVQSDCSNTLDPTTLDEPARADGQLENLRGVVSDLGTHLQRCTNSDDVIVP